MAMQYRFSICFSLFFNTTFILGGKAMRNFVKVQRLITLTKYMYLYNSCFPLALFDVFEYGRKVSLRLVNYALFHMKARKFELAASR